MHAVHEVLHAFFNLHSFTLAMPDVWAGFQVNLKLMPVPAVLVLVFAPACAPGCHRPTAQTPLAFVAGEPPDTLPPPDAAANVTATPATGFPYPSVTSTDGATGTAPPAAAL